MLIAADDALKSAAEVEDRTSEIDKKFEEASDMLSAFEKNFPFEPPKLGRSPGERVISTNTLR